LPEGIGFFVGVMLSILIGIVSNMSKKSPEDYYREGYKAALDSITNHLISAASNGSMRRAQGIFDDFIAWEYQSKTINCIYNLPWKNKK
jgi:hypothetical protein